MTRQRCPKDFPDARLHAWLDGRGEHALEVEEHLATCAECAAQVEAYKAAGAELRGLVDGAVGEVEPLLGLQAIRGKIAAAEEASLTARLKRWLEETWAFNRQAVAGALVAAALGALAAPAVILWVASRGRNVGPGDFSSASVVLESLEYGGDATAAVFRLNDGATTIIWVEPGVGPDTQHN